jgi:hypothetical protein
MGRKRAKVIKEKLEKYSFSERIKHVVLMEPCLLA